MKSRSNVLAALVVGALLLIGCGSDTDDEGFRENPSGEKITAEVDFPVNGTDLWVTAAQNSSDADLRRLAAALADLDGVAVTEADYGPRTVGIVFERDLSEAGRANVAERLTSLAGVASVSATGPTGPTPSS